MTKKTGKSMQSKVARVELRAGGCLDGPEKLWWRVGGIGKYLRNEKPPMSLSSNNQHHKNLLKLLSKVQSWEFY